MKSCSKESLQCGAAKRVITPPTEMLSGLRGLMGKKFVAIADDIYVRVLAVAQGEHTWVTCGFDLDKAPNPKSSMADITERFGIPEEYITFYGIHTHTTPALGNRENEANNNIQTMGSVVVETTKRYEAYIHDLLMEAVEEALAHLVPAQIRFGTAPCGCNINRCADSYTVNEDGTVKLSIHESPNPLGPVDHNVYVTAFETPEGIPIAFLTNYAMHNTIMFMNQADAEGNCAISGDVGGNVSQMVERKYPGSVALWCSGAAGDASPLRPAFHLRPEPGEPQHAYEYRQQHGLLMQMCANHYAAILQAIHALSAPFEDTTLEAGLCWTETPGRTVIREGKGMNQKVQIISGPDQPPYRIRLHFVHLGRLLLIGIGGELYSAYAAQLKAQFPDCDVLVLNHDASMIEDAGYIMDDNTWNRIAQVPANERTMPGAPPRYEVGYISSALSKAADQMMAQFTSK
ncbi:MAG: neutral/alkaline non-lysosomal ceramidase N-terminal domain-containing protein [Clostridiales bacterium]|nr:neutral/alkaline non-lysosomal ceramidase N-terminal domain-containing protein [Clostridiales bacterium]